MAEDLPSKVKPADKSVDRKELPQQNDLEPVKTQWGRIIACLPQLDSIDLIESSLNLGRSDECDIVIHKSKFLPDQLFYVSKEHFIITKDPEDVNIAYITDLSKNGTYVNDELIGRNNRIVLQNDDLIAIGEKLKVYIFKSMTSPVGENYLPKFLQKKYEPSYLLGKGACGEVRLVYEKFSCTKYAVKKIIKSRNTPSQLGNINHPSRIQTEIDILQKLSHPLVVNMKEIVETDDEVFLILEYVKGGELSQKINSTTISESNSKFLFYQMVLAVQYLHSNGITHRDLKPGNILLATSESQTLIKITDFGLSKMSQGYNMKTTCGTFYFIAPEIINQAISEYNYQVDVWSLGVILFYMLSNQLPFQSKDKSTLGKLIVTGTYSMRSPSWYEVSEGAKDLIKKMLTVNPKERITIKEILNHPWIAKDNLMQYRVENLLGKAQQCTGDKTLMKRKIREGGNEIIKGIKRMRLCCGSRKPSV